MNNSIGARQVHWHLHVTALAELEAVLTANKVSVDPEIIDQCRYALFGGVQAAHHLIEQEGWKPEMPSYPTTKLKLEHLQRYWQDRHQISPEDPSYMYGALDQLLFSTAKVKYLTEQLQIYIRFAYE
jgi:hypothetical protein